MTTLKAPYSLISQVIASPDIAISAADKAAFVDGLRTSYLWLGVLNTIAIVPSMLRGRRARNSGASGVSGQSSPEI